MKLGDDLIEKKFDVVEEKVDFLIENYRSLQQENEMLVEKIRDLEVELEKKEGVENLFSEQETLFQSKIDRLLNKLEEFSSSP